MLPQKLTIKFLRQQYLSGALSPAQVIAELINRVHAAEKNIWIQPPERSFIQPYLAALEKLDKKIHPLWGMPFAIKDNIDLAGLPTTAGCPAYSYAPPKNALAVERLIAAGAIPLGKTNLDQFATGLTGTRSPYGAVPNAFNKNYISGGSSSGSAVAVALGLAVFALGTDTAGSGRVPAALNGLCGFKPARGAWPTSGVVPACPSLDCVTVFAHTPADCRAVDSAVRGFAAEDKWSQPAPMPEAKTPRYICLPENNLEFFGGAAAQYQKIWQDFTDALRNREIEIRYINIEPFQKAAAILYDGPWIAERWAALGDFVNANPDAVLPVTKKILQSGGSGKLTAAELFKAWHALADYKQKARELLDGGVLILPTVGGVWTLEQVAADPVGTNNKLGLYTNHCNLLDLAALAVPYGLADKDLPFGVTIFALAQNEGYLFGSAELLSQTPAVTLAVHGLHMRGQPLNSVLLELGAEFLGETKTAPEYQLFALDTEPVKPGLLRVNENGASFWTELWRIPSAGLVELAKQTPAPLTFGKVKLADGAEIIGFLCENCATQAAPNISAHGGWRKFLQDKPSIKKGGGIL
jgi:allophanate hydrolase